MLSNDAARFNIDAADFYSKKNPEEAASFISSLFFNYCSGLIKKGQEKALQHDDLWQLAKRDIALVVTNKFHQSLDATKDPIKAPQVHSCTNNFV